MRAAAMTGKGSPLEVVDLPDPGPGSGELVLRIDSCGICGSDLHLVDVFDVPGLVLGHEFCGEVEAIGSEAKSRFTGRIFAAVATMSPPSPITIGSLCVSSQSRTSRHMRCGSTGDSSLFRAPWT
ncbi:MAG: alcohol dehydrogenase catalytic domain-containing protein, partial [Acidimicrobiales bacterium]